VKLWRGRAPALVYLKSDGAAPCGRPRQGGDLGNKGKTPQS